MANLSAFLLLLLNHTLARQCESVLMATKQVNGNGQNSTPRHAKTLSSPKLAGVIMSWMPLGMKNL